MIKRSAAAVRIPAHPEAEPRMERAEERILFELAAAGLVTRGEGTLTSFKPLRIAGKSVAETLLEDRNDRL
jgi:hypothetical protein